MDSTKQNLCKVSGQTLFLSLEGAATSIIFVVTKAFLRKHLCLLRVFFFCLFFLQQNFCHDKYLSGITYSLTKVLSWQAYFCRDKYVCCGKIHLLLRQRYACQDKTCFLSQRFVMTNIILPQQKFYRQKHTFLVMKDVLCRDKHTKLLSWQKCYLWQLLPMLFFRQQTNKLTNENCRLIWFRLFVLDAPALTTENQISIPFAFMTVYLSVAWKGSLSRKYVRVLVCSIRIY